MHDRLTSFCATCGVRQPAGPACLACRGALADLVDFESRKEALLAFRASFAERQARRLARDTSSVRGAPLAFAAGASVVLTMSLGIPLAAVSPLALVAIGASSAAGGFALGSALRALSPRFLLGKDARRQIDREVRALAERSLPITTATPPTRGGSIVVAGRIAGTPALSPFSDEPVLAARLVGEVQGRQIDDAWFAPGEISFDRASVDRRQILSLAWIEAASPSVVLPSALAPDLRARLDAYLLERGLEVAGDTPLSLTAVRVGDSVRVRGTPAPRQVSDGYRGQIEVVDLVDVVIELAASPPVEPILVPGPFVPPSMDET